MPAPRARSDRKALALDPGHGPEPGTAEGIPLTDAVPDLELGPTDVGNGSPAALIVLDPPGQRHEKAPIADTLTRRDRAARLRSTETAYA
jgi:hypothetical protein